MNYRYMLIHLLAIPFLLLSGNQLIAEAIEQNLDDVDERQWYQIEVVVFANNNPDAAYEEQWPEELGLSYPTNLTHLRDTVTSVVDNNPNVPLSNAELLNTEHNARDTGDVIIESIGASLLEPNDETPQQIRPLIAFSQLPHDELTLSNAASNITDEYSFRPLFHKAWRQTIDGRNKANSILITGGEMFDDHFELEGSIKISVERYLHIDTDLWLNQFVSKTGKEQPNWPLLPPIPQLIDESNAAEIEIPLQNQADSSNEISFTGSLQLTDTETTGDKQAITTLSDLTAHLEKAPKVDPLSGANKNLEQQLRLMTNAQYAVERTVVMRQHRRMRSKELHYIDHPLFGVLIKVVPYDQAGNEDTPEPG